MITDKKSFKEYLESDRIALRKSYNKPKPFIDLIWKYEILLRKCEFYNNCKKGFFSKILGKVLKIKFIKLGQRLGFSIPLNVFDKGLYIAHIGSIVVNQYSSIGKNCRIHEGTCIGADGTNEAPIIGNNVFIATGAKIIGNVRIADDVAIGANAVVVKDILEPNTTWGGVPAKKISDNGSGKYIKVANDDEKIFKTTIS